MRLTVATWNINSLRLRQGLLAGLVEALAPDILFLQETKVMDAAYPTAIGAACGLPHQLYRGMKAYNGVAILSRLPLVAAPDQPDWCGRGDCRHLAARVMLPSGPLTLHNYYVPAGGDVPDVAANEKFAHKMQFLAEVADHFTAAPPRRCVLGGDLNIAPLAQDVWSHTQLSQVVSHTEGEIAALAAWQATGFHDAVRHFVPPDQKLYSWWSYRNRDWRASDRGRRLDHVWVSADLVGGLRGQHTHKPARDWVPASDHVPVAVTLDL